MYVNVMYYFSRLQNLINWPTCEITHCMQIPEQEGFTTDKSGPIEVDEKITYECTDWLVVNDTSLSLESTCQQTGEFTPISEWPGCRSALPCPALPTPPENSYLVGNSTEVLEFEYALFACQDGARFAENEAEVEDNYFQLLCGANGEYAAEEEISWPTCIVENCTALVEKAGYISATQMPIAVNEQATYQCENDQVADIGKGQGDNYYVHSVLKSMKKSHVHTFHNMRLFAKVSNTVLLTAQSSF